MSDSLWPCGLQHARVLCPSLSSWSLFKFMSIVSMMSFNHLILGLPSLLLFSTFPSIRVFSNDLDFCLRWPKYWSFSFSISPFNEDSGLISFWSDWCDLLTAQGTVTVICTTVQKHQFFNSWPSLWSNSHIHTWLLEKP